MKAGDTIYIRSDGTVEGTDKIQREGNVYTFTNNIYDSIVVEKDNIVIDGAGYVLEGTGSGNGIALSGKNITIRNFNIKQFYDGIFIKGSGTTNSGRNMISGNNITDNSVGIYLVGTSPDNIFRNNKMVDNEQNFAHGGSISYGLVQDVDASNTVNGKPIYYWVNRQNMSVPSDAGYVALVNCTNITVQNLKLSNNGQGILLVSTTDSTIAKNTIIKCGHGVFLYESSMNTIYGNNITSNYIGFYIEAYGNNGVYNRIFHNNFINNTRNAGIGETPYWVPFTISIWDYGYPSDGNYWSDYNGTDNDGDGIGDTPYIIDENNQDNYPLVNVIPEFPSWIILPLLLMATLAAIIFKQRLPKAPSNL